MSGRTGTDARGIQGVPLATGSQDEEDRVQGVTIAPPWPATAEAMRVRMVRQQGLQKGPQFI
jgi:hypothetical protein